MKTALPRLIARAALFAAFVAPFNLHAQTPAGPSRPAPPTRIETTSARIARVITQAEARFKEGELHLKAGRRKQAREQFDKAVDTILKSGLDVRASPRLQTYYLKLVEKISRLEVPRQGGRVEPGFKHQKFEPSPREGYSKLVLTPEELDVAPEDLVEIEVARNASGLPVEANPLIQQFINFYQGRGRATMEADLRHSGRFMQMARKIFREEGVPEDLVWLGQAGSNWNPAPSGGLWEFSLNLGGRYGLRVTPWIDERNGFEKATRAAARYLKDLYSHFGRWELALAAYSAGQGDIDRAVARANSKNYWKIVPYLARETRNFVPAVMATVLIAKNPEKYGFGAIHPDPPLSYDVVEVPTATSLHLVARATGVSVDDIRALNPELRRDVTPYGEAYRGRIPAGRADQFVSVLKSTPKRERDRVPETEPRVMVVKATAGDTPAKLAERFNASAEEVARLNQVGVNSEFPAGRAVRLPIPGASSRRRSRAPNVKPRRKVFPNYFNN